MKKFLTLVLTGSTFIAAMNNDDLINSILKDPSGVLNNVVSVHKEFDTEFDTLTGNRDSFEKLVEQYETKCPFFLSAECNALTCSLSREKNPKYRDSFESAVSNALLEKLNENSKISYTDFGSGGCFSLLVALTKTLKQKSDADIAVHAIDPQYDYCVKYRTACGGTREIMPTDPKLLAQEKMYNAWDKKYEGQIISWLRTAFPQANLSLFVHDTHSSYVSYIDSNNLPYPDVVSAADIQSDMPEEGEKAMADYSALCTKILAKKPTARNILLAKNDSKTEGCLSTFSVQPSSPQALNMTLYQTKEPIL